MWSSCPETITDLGDASWGLQRALGIQRDEKPDSDWGLGAPTGIIYRPPSWDVLRRPAAAGLGTGSFSRKGRNPASGSSSPVSAGQGPHRGGWTWLWMGSSGPGGGSHRIEGSEG